jgi:transposase
MSANR